MRPLLQRGLIVTTAAFWSAYISVSYQSARHGWPSDLGQIKAAGGMLLAGLNPYNEIGPGLRYNWQWPLLYPIPATWLLLPFQWAPLWVLDAVLCGAAGASLSWWITRKRLLSPQLVVFASFSWMYLVIWVQPWEPLMLLMSIAPPMGVLIAAKPTAGAIVWLATPRWKPLAWAAGFAMLTILWWPSWPLYWLQQTRTQAAAITAPGFTLWGLPLLLAGLRWKRDEARLLLALACVPHTPAPYEAVLWFLIPVTWPEAIVLLIGSWVEMDLFQALGPFPTYIATASAHNIALLVCCYLPCLLMVLRRPNVETAQTSLHETGRVRTPFNIVAGMTNRRGAIASRTDDEMKRR